MIFHIASYSLVCNNISLFLPFFLLSSFFPLSLPPTLPSWLPTSLLLLSLLTPSLFLSLPSYSVLSSPFLAFFPSFFHANDNNSGPQACYHRCTSPALNFKIFLLFKTILNLNIFWLYSRLPQVLPGF